MTFHKKTVDETFGVGSKTCHVCRRNLAYDKFGPNKKSKDGIDYRCKDCNKARSLATRRKRTEYWMTHDPYSERVDKNKLCPLCKNTKSILDFSKCCDTVDGLQRCCKPCQLDYWRRSKYGRTLEEGGAFCEICGHDRNLTVDHCHRTGLTRGNLCQSCNMGLGHFSDSKDFIQKALIYLNRWHPDTKPK